MDLDEAIRAHTSWKLKLAACLKKPGCPLKAAEVRADNRSELGQWLYGEGRKFSLLPEYMTLVTLNARFHRAAAQIVERANAGLVINEEAAFGSDSEFASASRDVIAAIKELDKKVVPRPVKSVA
ncbi:MAG: CZB domain-containing protein [Rhodomicrobium sp.]